ncbi:MAG TPA: methyltransferase domain-containing protein [Pirellulales bacterium]|jgi:SAM-dependent methyltransferase|nr:methyltransferase domain-containing protein [Pirellulales bacterium]
MTSDTDIRTPQVDARRQHRLERVRKILACPDCGHPLASAGDVPIATCPQCGRQWQLESRQFVFEAFSEQELKADWLNRAKEAAKRRLGKFYPWTIKILSPVHWAPPVAAFLSRFHLDEELVADLGSGTSQYDENVVCVDGASYPNVHVVCRLDHLPFGDGTLAGIISIAVLEHVPDPPAHVKEMFRVLRPGGRVLCYIPFIVGYHASPDDFQRYTKSGMRELFRDFEIVSLRPGAGPTSGMLWILQEWLALVFSFGSQRLYRLLMPLTWILSPLKYLDVLLIHHPAASVIASGFLIEARKPGG